MGWLYYHREPGETDRDHFAGKFGEGYEILDCATKRNVFYAALKTPEDKVIAFVALIQRVRGDYYNFGYKDMDESMGPSEAECPARILDLLTPVEDLDLGENGTQWATEWRKRCRENADKQASRPKVRKGDTVKLASKFKFTNGVEDDTFTLVDGKRNRWTTSSGMLVRLPARGRWPEYEVV